ncbi:MAG: hypothetical protein HUU02_11305 [Bacteroidetes bacterium]|nr:hypothetical protein [Bacteroidota bacterium]
MLNDRLKTVTTYCLLASLTFVYGCAGALSGGGKSGGRYIYQYTMTEPSVNDQLLYKDDYITVQFKFDESAVKFQLQNVSDLPLSIVWENVAISLNNRAFPVRNLSTLYQTELVHPLPVMIPSLGYIREVVIPRDNITLEKEGWKEKDLFPTDDMGSAARKKLIMKYNGSVVKLMLPVRIGEVVQDYAFTFKVKGISALPQNVRPPVKERPTPPPVMTASASNALLPIVIAGGILGLAIYALSKEKASPIGF